MVLVSEELMPRVGSRISIDKADLLGGAAAGEIRALLERRGVIIFRDLALDDAELSALGATLGNVLMHGKEGPQDSIIKVTFDKSQQRQEFGGYFRSTFYWHMDGMYEDVPPLASILSPRVLSPAGGETEFANTYAAWDDLPESEKTALEGLKVLHSIEAAYRKFTPDPSDAQVASWRSYGEKVHPLVWTHRTGRKSIVNGHTTDHVLGMSRKDSDALLGRLMAWMTQRHYVYQHQWRLGDLLIWDNSGTMHRVLDYDMDCGRRLHRVTLLGEEPLSIAA